MHFIPNISYETIEKVSSLTHAHQKSKISCNFYIEIAKSMLLNDLEIKGYVKLGSDKIKDYYKNSNELKYFERIFNDDLEDG